jgi:methylase of polypeptide subunit release factors
VGHNQAKAVTKLFETSGYVEITVHEDLAGRARIVAGRKQVG